MGQNAVLCGAPPTAEMLMGYYNKMVEPKPFIVRSGEDFRLHQRQLRERILKGVDLSPLPEHIPLDIKESELLSHSWCTVWGITYQLWPGIRSRAFLYMPREFQEMPAPAMICPVGHWEYGNAHPDVQVRCLNFARMGYVVLCTTQHHYEDLAIGFSHQTLMIWNNMRGLDLLQSLTEVDRERIGCAGASGGGLQTQMLAALDDRVKVATIVGLTCDYREIMFPYRAHCDCNHWPGVMQYTDQPEIAAIALPRPIQFLTMNDWTRNFERDNLPQIRALYEANGVGDRIDHHYWPTPHIYDRLKRQRTYMWMEHWLRRKVLSQPPVEPETETFPPEKLMGLFDLDTSPVLLKSGDVLDKSSDKLGQLYRSKYMAVPTSSLPTFTASEVEEQREILRELLGMNVLQPCATDIFHGSAEEYKGLTLEALAFPSESTISVPTLLLHSHNVQSRELCIICDDQPKEQRLTLWDVVEGAQFGSLMILPDVRFVGALSLERLKGQSKQLVAFPIADPYDELPEYDKFWTRNSILWGRPLPGMTATDVLAVLDGVLKLKNEGLPTRLVAQGTVAAGALFAACLDDRITNVDIDLGDRDFANGTLQLVPNALRYGDIDHWASLAKLSRKGSGEVNIKHRTVRTRLRHDL